MSFNIFALSKTELKKRTLFRCVHGHTGIDHPKCYDKKNNIEEKIGFLDIETSNLKANYGFVICYVIKSGDGKILSRCLKPNEIKKGIYDRDLLKQLCKDVRKFDRIFTYYGARFDIPYLRTRTMFWKQDFPFFKEIKHTDLYFTVKSRMNLHSRRLAVVCNFLGISAKMHTFNPQIWFRCMAGDKKALDYAVVHCKEDVNSTEGVWKRLQDFMKLTQTSL